MLNRKKAIIGAGGVAVALTMALAALGPTGAYFTDTEQGGIEGTVGSIKVDAVGSLNLNYTNLLPGEVQTVSAQYTNNGLNHQDVWVVFNNADALHALNDLGNYGEFHISSGATEIFASANLNDDADGTPLCGGFSTTGCWPVPAQIKVASNVAPDGGGTVSFGFGYSGLLEGQSATGGGLWNSYPVSTLSDSNPDNEGYGLPYQIVATQVGQQP